MSQRKLKVLLNIGLDDQKKYGIPNGAEGDGESPPQQDEIISVDEDLANILVNVLQCCKDYDAKAEEAHAAKVKAADEKRLEAAIASGMIAAPPAPATAHAAPSHAVKDK